MDSQHLVPELALTKELPLHWQSRFEKAILLMYNSLEQSPAMTWEDIAITCAISPPIISTGYFGRSLTKHQDNTYDASGYKQWLKNWSTAQIALQILR